MKAERRHELKTNALARGIEDFPEYWREYGSKILLVILVAAVVFLLVRYWNDKKVRDAELVSSSMQTVQVELDRLRGLPILLENGASTSFVAEQRQKVAELADQAISTVLNTAKDSKTLANAFLARGDLNWALANFPELPGASTLPATLQIQNRDSLLDQARSSYEKVLEPAYSGSPSDVFYARIGLAAIAENQGQWDKAKAQYEAIANAADMPKSFKDYASDRLAQLPQIQTAALIVPRPPSGPEAPATRAIGPMPMPLPTTSAPSTQP
jgi:tetratricopeptide (TPR) repeat protein